MNNKRYFSVLCKCGHTGSRMYYIPIAFAIEAENGKEAAAKSRWLPRVKHHHKDCILSVKELSYTEYLMLRDENKSDPYLKCGCIQEQKCLDMDDRMVLDPHYSEKDAHYYEKEYQRHPNFIGKTMIRNPKKYMKNYCCEEGWA